LGDAQSGAVVESGASLTPEAIARALLGLSPVERARLAALLLGQQPGEGEARP
jgi:hypothetical protein